MWKHGSTNDNALIKPETIFLHSFWLADSKAADNWNLYYKMLMLQNVATNNYGDDFLT